MKPLEINLNINPHEEETTKSTSAQSSPINALPSFLHAAQDEYTKEFERSRALEAKITALITVVLGALALVIPNVSSLKMNPDCFCTYVILSILMAAGVVILVVSLFYLLRLLSPSGFQRISPANFSNPNLQSKSEETVMKELIRFYCEANSYNSTNNDKTAKKLISCIRYSLIGFTFIIVSTFILSIMEVFNV